MNNWRVEFTPAAEADYLALDGHQQIIVTKAIKKVSQNPLPHSKGGYGIPLGNKHGVDLTGYMEIKLKGQNLRVIYELIDDIMVMNNIIISKRSDSIVYKAAAERVKKI